MTADQAIERSISHTEIVTLDYTDDLVFALRNESDDSVKANYGETEYWGTRDGRHWRVHLYDASSDDRG